jgi:hypothetical protein
MRAKRTVLVTLGALALVAALAAGAAFTPAVQTWEARRFLSSHVRGSTLGRLSVGPSRMSIEGLRVEWGGAVLEVPRAEAQLGVLSAALGRGLLVRNLTAKGWTLDLTRRVAAAAPAQAQAGAGARAAETIGAVLGAFNVPRDVSLDGVDLEGAVFLPDDLGRPMGRAQVRLAGGGLAAGRSGRFGCDADLDLDDPAAPVSSVAVRGTLEADMDPSGTLARAGLKLDATAKGPQFPDGIRLLCTASAARQAGRTTYSLALTRGADRIAAADAVSPDGSRRLSGAWAVDLRDTDLAPFALGRRLPAFHLAGDGSYEMDAASGDSHASGRARASADRLGVVAPALAALGSVSLSADFDLARVGDLLRVDRLQTSLGGSGPVASVRALQAFELNLASGELRVARPSDDIVGISVSGLPLAWLAGALPGVALSGDDAQGQFVMRAENGRLALRTKAPLSAANVSLSRGGRALASGLEASAFVLADYSLQGWQAQVAPLALRSDGVKILYVEARLGRLAGRGQALKAAGSWSASLPQLLAQPAFGGLPRLASGEASGSFEASFGRTREVRLKVALDSLSAAAAQSIALPKVASDARVDLHPDGSWEFSVPVRLDYGLRAASLACSGSVSPGDAWRFDATLTADRLDPGDLAAFAVLSSGAPSAGAVQAGAAAPRAFWPALRGRVAFVLRDVSAAGVDLKNVAGTLSIEPSELRLASGVAAVGDSSAVRVDGGLAFAPGAPRPYTLRATVSADNLESAPLFRAMDPSRPPAVDGRFDLAAHAAGSGADLEELLAAVRGDCSLVSKDGRFRVLQVDVVDAIKQSPSRIAGALDSVTALFGKKADRIAEAMAECASGLSEIRYDQLKLTLVRGEDLDIVVKDLALTAPEQRITGSGRISYAPGVAVASQPLSLDLDMGVAGALAKFMGVVGLLSDGKDELGYTHLYEPIRLRGTLRAIDRSQLRQMLIQAPLRKGGGLIDKFLGR